MNYFISLIRRPERVCWCAYLPEKPIKIRGKIIVLQHPGEEKRNLKTAPMLFHGMESGCCIIYHGKKFPTRKHEGLAELLGEPNTYVLFPGAKSKCLKQIVQNSSPDESYNLVLIDGTWSQAKSMYFHSPFLHDLPQVNLILLIYQSNLLKKVWLLLNNMKNNSISLFKTTYQEIIEKLLTIEITVNTSTSQNLSSSTDRKDIA